mgnify:CR=1 FL=1
MASFAGSVWMVMARVFWLLVRGSSPRGQCAVSQASPANPGSQMHTASLSDASGFEQ